MASSDTEQKESVTVLISTEEINRRLSELAIEISRDYAGKQITMVCAMKGAVIFLADLARKLSQNVEFDFINISSYGNETRPGELVLRKDMDLKPKGRHILLIEDIIDSGHTLVFLRKHIAAMEPASLKICVLLDKPDRRQVQTQDPLYDYLGFSIPDEFVVGYGLDYAQRYRNLPYVGVLHFE
jgi:hypoxanthine phosphoribosyltransferase